MGKSTISMVIFNGYDKLPEGCSIIDDMHTLPGEIHHVLKKHTKNPRRRNDRTKLVKVRSMAETAIMEHHQSQQEL